jgi:hypothetical protein
MHNISRCLLQTFPAVYSSPNARQQLAQLDRLEWSLTISVWKAKSTDKKAATQERLRAGVIAGTNGMRILDAYSVWATRKLCPNPARPCNQAMCNPCVTQATLLKRPVQPELELDPDAASRPPTVQCCAQHNQLCYQQLTTNGKLTSRGIIAHYFHAQAACASGTANAPGAPGQPPQPRSRGNRLLEKDGPAQ